MPTFKLDGRDVEFRPGEMIIEAAARAGVHIPYYCYHPDLSRPANCRMCLVEAVGAPKLVPSCQQACNEKSVILTGSPRVKSAQADVQEFLLINHPLDCPICDQAGECKLQQYAFLFGKPSSSMEEPKVKLDKRKVLGPHVVLDQERCIACTRCVRFCAEVTGTGELAMVARGSHNTVDLHPEAWLDNNYSGCVVDMCPVGALTDRQFRFQARVWYLQSVVSTCTLCSRGCNVTVDARGERERRPEVKRVRARRNPDVNGSWICDIGRYGYLEPRNGARPQAAVVAGSPTADPVHDLDAAHARVAELLRDRKGRSGWLAVVASGSETLEELHGLARLARAADPSAALVVPARPDAPEDALLLRTDRSANQRGARLMGWSGDAKAAASAEVVIACDGDLRPGSGLDASALAASATLVALVAHERAWATGAAVVIPLANAYEKAGTIVNFEGVVQRLNRAVTPPRDARPAHHHAAAIARLAAIEGVVADTADALRELCAGPLAPLDAARLDEWGARLPDTPGGAATYFLEPLQLFTAAPKSYAEGEYLPFVQSDPPPPALHVAAGVPPLDRERAQWFGPPRTAVEDLTAQSSATGGAPPEGERP